jgi:hypothetical protein
MAEETSLATSSSPLIGPSSMTRVDLITEELLRRHHRAHEAQRHWCARNATGPSVIRVFAKGTKTALMDALLRLPVHEIERLDGRAEFERWYEHQLRQVAGSIRKSNPDNQRIRPGIKWGHAAKILSIYLRGLVLHSRYFPDRVVRRVRPWLFVPVDSYTIKNLRSCRVVPPFDRIKDIATREHFYFVQDLLAKRCGRGVARIVFDDSWADRSNPTSGTSQSV